MGGRRRGADLEQAILEAAWFELSARGYAGLTMEAVAERVGVGPGDSDDENEQRHRVPPRGCTDASFASRSTLVVHAARPRSSFPL